MSMNQIFFLHFFFKNGYLYLNIIQTIGKLLQNSENELVFIWGFHNRKTPIQQCFLESSKMRNLKHHIVNFYHVYVFFSSRIERNVRMTKETPVLRCRFLMIFCHFYHVYVFFFGSRIGRNGRMTKQTPVLRSRFLMIFWSFLPCIRVFWL